MNAQERSILENFLTQLAQVRGVNKDPEADRLIRQAFERQPDAAYLLVQRALLLGQALDQAKARMAELEQAQAQSGRGFLDPGASGWASPSGASSGGQPGGAPGYGRPAAQPPQYPSYNAPPPPAYAPYAAPAGPPVSGMGGGMSSFLGQAAATAAGVAGGAFLFEGIENLFGHHGGGFGGEVPAQFPTEDVTVNNYYYPEETRPEEFSHSVADNTEEDPDIDTFTDDDDGPTDDQDFV